MPALDHCQMQMNAQADAQRFNLSPAFKGARRKART